MKDSVGSTLLLKIFVVFMIVYIIFMASILNYTKAFRIKNQIVNIINRYGSYEGPAAAEIKDYFAKSDMYGECKLLEGNNDFGTYIENRCEIKEYKVASVAGGSYYKVRIYVTFQFPLISDTLQIPITGETKTLHNQISPPSEIKFKEVNNSLVIKKEKLPTDDCMPEDTHTVPGKACCSRAACSGGGELRTNGSSCSCYNIGANGLVYTGSPYCDPSNPGSQIGDTNCYCCYDCDAVPALTVAKQGSSSNPKSKVEVKVNVENVGDVGIRMCSPVGMRTVSFTVSNECTKTKTVSCENRLGKTASIVVDVYSTIDGCSECNYSNGTCSKCSGTRKLSTDKKKCCSKISNCEGNYDSNCKCTNCKFINGCHIYDTSTCKCSECYSTLKKCDDGSCKATCPVKKCYCCGNAQGVKCSWAYSAGGNCVAADSSKCG